MNETAFIEKREPDWKRLSYLGDRADVSPQNLTPQELMELFRLYRRCSRDLALVRTQSTNTQLIDFLNDLMARSYSAIYRTKRKPFWPAVWSAIELSARTVRKRQYFVLASFLTFLVSIIFSYTVCATNPAMRDILEPKQYKATFDQWKRGEFTDRSGPESVEYSAFYSSNNPRVAIIQGSIAAATFGIGTAAMIWQNGVMLGTLTYEMGTVHKVPFLYASIMPHGVTELSGLVVSGAAGYSLGWAIIAPGRKKRGDALAEAGKDGFVLLCTSVALMFLAAPVEGFFSFNPRVPIWAKVLFAIAIAIAWAAFWLGFGREPGEGLSEGQSQENHRQVMGGVHNN
ncbi:MAG TPA: stage II sporulation protein M [Fimbriimonadaceae bacterium]|jgi:uncharacterized membrane protein SpoIIM required for sporulation